MGWPSGMWYPGGIGRTLGAMVANLGVAPPEAPGNPSCLRVLHVGGESPGRSIVSGMMPGRIYEIHWQSNHLTKEEGRRIQREQRSQNHWG
jgi:hypothetical protein